MDIELLGESDHSHWNAFVDGSPQGSLYASTGYLDCLGITFDILVVREGGEIVSGIVLSKNEVSAWSNPLLVKYLGVLHVAGEGKPTTVASRRYRRERLLIEKLPRHSMWAYAFHPNYANWLPFYWAGYGQTTKYSYRIEFEEQPRFRESYDSALSRRIKTAKKNELEICEVTIDEFVDMVLYSYKETNTRAPFSRERLHCLTSRLTEAGLLRAHGVRDADGNLHAVAGVAYDRRSANLILNGMDRKFGDLGGNQLLVDHLIEFASENCRVFDFEGSMHERIERFYRRFGGVPVPYYEISKNNLATSGYRMALSTYKRFLA